MVRSMDDDDDAMSDDDAIFFGFFINSAPGWLRRRRECERDSFAHLDDCVGSRER